MASKQRDKDQQDVKERRSLRPRRSLTVETNENAGGMSLDVLAQVASETLQKEPKSHKNSPRKKVSLRSINNIERLSLDQILGLTEKTIMNLFTEVNSNEMARTFTFTCHLVPKSCQKKCTSFGSEMRARADMKKHIYEHLEELQKQDASSRDMFTAEPLTAKRKRLINTFVPSKKRVSKPTPKSPVGVQAKNGIESNSPSSRPKKQGHSSYEDDSEEEIQVKWEKDQEALNAIGFIPVRDKMKFNHVSKDSLKKEFQKVINETGADSETETSKQKDEIEHLATDIFGSSSLGHDHCYTTTLGGLSHSVGYDDPESDTEGLPDTTPEEDVASSLTIPGTNRVVFFINNKEGGGRKKNPIPILFLRHRSPDETVPMVSVEEIIDLSESEEKDNPDSQTQMPVNPVTISSGQKPYPPMPKSRLAKRGRIGFDISDISTEGSDEESDFLQKKKKSLNPMGREGREGNLGWEPKLALKYIRELKGRKKDENIPLKCKICNDKTFTAAATLMYHYRSHAGIKPFVCLICNTTFTRQHSLNYHMLIHNNQSRFTCKDCGRKFRHPSHFKEHLRRHTGETPFECADCGQRFKTRNTYKRHLKTRHGKLLTASGIHELTREEFEKVRTKRYSVLNLPDISYQMPDLVFSKISEKKKMKKNVLSSKKMIGQGEYVFTEHKPRSGPHDVLNSDDIKTEVMSSDEDDPELNNILQVLEKQPKEADVKFMKKEHESPTKPFTTGIFVNKKYAEKNSVQLPMS